MGSRSRSAARASSPRSSPGAIFGALAGQESEEASRLNEELGGLLGGLTFLIFGAVLLGPALKHVSWQIALYAVLSLTLSGCCRSRSR